MADPRITQIIRDAGGIVHSDGNIFFTNQAQFLQAASQAQQPVQQTDPAIYPDGFDSSCGLPAWAMREANRTATSLIGKRAWDVPCVAAALVAAAPQQPAQQAVRMLTEQEVSDCCGGCRNNSAITTWIGRAIGRFCEVNGIALPPAAKEGEKKQ